MNNNTRTEHEYVVDSVRYLLGDLGPSVVSATVPAQTVMNMSYWSMDRLENEIQKVNYLSKKAKRGKNKQII